MVVRFGDESKPVLILDAKILSMSRPETHFRLASFDSGVAGAVGVTWRILERGDGALLQLVCATASPPHVLFDGSLKGQRKTIPVASPSAKPSIWSPVGGLLAGAFCLLSMSYFESVVKRSRFRGTAKGFFLPIAGALCVAGILVGMMYLLRTPTPPFGW